MPTIAGEARTIVQPRLFVRLPVYQGVDCIELRQRDADLVEVILHRCHAPSCEFVCERLG